MITQTVYFAIKNRRKYAFSVKVSKVDATPTTAVSMAPENVQLQKLTLIEVHKKFTVVGYAMLHKTSDELVVGRTGISREEQIIVEPMLEITQNFHRKLYVHHKLFEVVSSDVFSDQLTVLNIDKLVENLNKCDKCIGNIRAEKNADLVFSDKNDMEKAILETVDMEDIRSVATIRIINYTVLVFSHFHCERKKLSAMASRLKENVSFNKVHHM